MAPVGSVSPHAAASPGGSSSSNSGSSAGSLAASDSLANEQTFLQLLVAQLKNQDPSNPMDGTQFVSQLAEFSQLEQQLAMRQDLDKIAGSITVSPTTPSSGTGTGGASAANNNSNQPVS